jgi:hypothetical protein
MTSMDSHDWINENWLQCLGMRLDRDGTRMLVNGKLTCSGGSVQQDQSLGPVAQPGVQGSTTSGFLCLVSSL